MSGVTEAPSTSAQEVTVIDPSRRGKSKGSGDQAQCLDDQAFLRALQSCRMDAAEFRHRDHVRLAWILLRKMPLAEVLSRVGTDLKRFASHHGASEIYNETLTWVYVMVINQRMQSAAEDPIEAHPSFDDFCAGNPDLFGPVDQFMANFYLAAHWRSDLAKATFVLPERWE